MPRVAPITTKPDVPPAHQPIVDKVVEVFGNVRGPFSMLLHSPKLAEKVLELVKFFRDESVVEGKLRSIAILTAVREKEAAYVWNAQVGAARRNDLRDEVIDVIRAKGDAARLAKEEQETTPASSCARIASSRRRSTRSRSATVRNGSSS